METIAEQPLRSVHTTNFPQLLAELGGSLLVTTYQAGKLVLLRNCDGVLNTHFRNFAKPMGMAISGGRLAVGASVDIQEFHNVPASCELLNSADLAHRSPQVDACFLPRRTHTTGDVQIHELAWVGSELWFVNTAFSCLSTRSDAHSFDVRWRPKFVEQLAPIDCCHLNGLAIRDGKPRYVTALGETGAAGGWRDNKRDGGVLIDVDSDEVIVRGLSMPHSPRWHRGELWLLESGDGSIGRVDLQSGGYEPIARLPGFTRGLAFYGPLAFVGLSQVRESAVFSGFPLVERDEERFSGVWVVNIDTGETAAFMQFDGEVQEVFAVELLLGATCPDVVNDDPQVIGRAYVLPEDALALVPGELRSD